MLCKQETFPPLMALRRTNQYLWMGSLGAQTIFLPTPTLTTPPMTLLVPTMALFAPPMAPFVAPIISPSQQTFPSRPTLYRDGERVYSEIGFNSLVYAL